MAYAPVVKPGTEARLRSVSARRARLFAGGAYFRSKDIGQHTNKISVRVIEFSATDAICVVQNENIISSEIVSNNVPMNILSLKLDYNEKIELIPLATPIVAARYYSISAQIAPPPPTITELGNFKFSNFFNVPSYLSAIVPPSTSNTILSDTIVITPRTRVYRLQSISAVDPDTGATVTGWDLLDLRSQVNSNDPWVEMPSPGTDVQDADSTPADLTISVFQKLYLAGGDGVPLTPSNENTGPSKSLIFVAYSEGPNGAMRDIAEVREWVGESASSGQWLPYHT